MIYEVTKDNNTFILSKEKLVEQLLKPILDNRDEKIIKHSLELVEVFISKEMIKGRIIDMLSIAFMLGYYYKSFLSKNNVEIKE